MSYTITINNAAITLVAGTLDIENLIGERSTCRFDVRDDTGTAIYLQGMPVRIADDNNAVAFFGYVHSATQRKRDDYGPGLIHSIECSDATYLADKRVAARSYTNMLAGDIVGDLVTNYLQAEGVLGARALPTFTRASTAYTSTGTQVTSGNPRYETGQFGGQAITLEEGTTNILTANLSNVETNSTDFTALNSATLTRDTTQHWESTASLKTVTPNVQANEGFGAFLASTSFTASATYTVSAWLRGTGTCTLRFRQQGGTQYAVSSVITLTSTWTRYTVTGTLPGTLSGNIGLAVQTDVQQAATIYADGMQIEQLAYSTSWQIGGTARVNEVLALPPSAQLANPQEGCVEIGVYVNATSLRSVGAFQRLFNLGKPADDSHGIIAYHESGNWTLETRDDAGNPSTVSVSDSLTPVGWHRFTLNWSATANIIELYIDGVLQGSAANPKLPSALHGTAGAWVGSYGSGHILDTYIDEFRVSSRRRTATEISTHIGFALSLDLATVYLLQFAGNLTPARSINGGPTINSAVFNYVPVSQCIDKLAEQAGYWWTIDQNKCLIFRDFNSPSAPFTGDGTHMDVSTVKVVRGNSQYRNVQYVLGGTDVTSTQTETRKGDGNTKAFAMGFPLSSAPTITVNSVSKTVGVKGVDTGKDWYWSKGDPVVYQDTGGTTLISTDTLQVQYVGQYNFVALSQDTAGVTSQQATEGGITTGFVESVDVDTSLTSQSAAFQSAAGKLARFSQQCTTVTFETLDAGLQPGQSLTVNLPDHNLNTVTALIESVSTRDDPVEMVLRYPVKAIIGPVDTNWVAFFKKITDHQQIANISLGQSSMLVVLQTVTESWGWSESVTETVYSCPIPSTSLFPSSSLNPC